MSWINKLNPFQKKEETAAGGVDAALPAGLPPDVAADLKSKGAMSAFFRKWKDPAFLKQMRVLAAHMQKDGVDMKDYKAVQAWIEKNKDRIESGALEKETTKPGETFVKVAAETGRNEPCSCGSGKKFKKCHGR